MGLFDTLRSAFGSKIVGKDRWAKMGMVNRDPLTCSFAIVKGG